MPRDECISTVALREHNPASTEPDRYSIPSAGRINSSHIQTNQISTCLVKA
jgi:hypothetical protein